MEGSLGDRYDSFWGMAPKDSDGDEIKFKERSETVIMRYVLTVPGICEGVHDAFTHATLNIQNEAVIEGQRFMIDRHVDKSRVNFGELCDGELCGSQRSHQPQG
ncbi:hypothetical protein CYMTET_17880 [Cymbomonas tetramitiformis]|uniref:Uncharacterized protein n=1 Tax=Cymbomonas tetramitiformis TaxID=36881 RepID=A0AAE0G9R8_9CHLO|nr:hypothetical protein CYMTET_17880 [Cymbomonas tetramitiformis]